jgi:Family of unknown function (DUF5335)
MPTQEIPSYEWSRFVDEFSRRHEGWLVSIEILNGENGNQMLVRDVPLEGITVDANEVGEDQITIIAGVDPNAHLSHTVASPDRIWLKQSAEGADDALEIESFEGTVLITFLSATLPEMVDGVLSKRAEAGRRHP